MTTSVERRTFKKKPRYLPLVSYLNITFAAAISTKVLSLRAISFFPCLRVTCRKRASFKARL